MNNIIKAIADALQDPTVSMLKVEEMFHQAVMSAVSKHSDENLEVAIK